MARHEVRMKRVGEEIKNELSDIIRTEMTDPRIPAVFNITGVDVSKDLGFAYIYFSQLPDDDAAVEATEDVLRKATGFLRTSLASRIRMQFMPELRFMFDKSSRNYARMSKIIDDAVKAIPRREGEPPAEGEPGKA
jgi:ribosome-binding factor A